MKIKSNLREVHSRRQKYQELIKLASNNEINKQQSAFLTSSQYDFLSKVNTDSISHSVYSKTIETRNLKKFMQMKELQKDYGINYLKQATKRHKDQVNLHLSPKDRQQIQDDNSESDDSIQNLKESSKYTKDALNLSRLESVTRASNKQKQEENHAMMIKFIDYLTTENFTENVHTVLKHIQDRKLKKGFDEYSSLPDPQM